MTLRDYLRVIRAQWWIIALLGALCLAASAAYTVTRPKQYAASTQVFVSVSSPGGTDLSTMVTGSSFVQQRVVSYTDVLTSPSMLSRVVTRLNLPLTAGQLSGMVTAESPQNTVLINITVTDTEPKRAAEIADAIASEFPSIVSELETPDGADTSPVKVSITREASAPVAPISPNLRLNLALGLLAGFCLGIGFAVLRDQLNTAVSGQRDLEQLAGSIPLGVVPHDSGASGQPVVGPDDDGPRAEAFRALRTNLRYADVDNPPRVVVLTSALPGEGKTTTACNIATTMALAGSRTVLVEGDLRRPNVGHYLGLSDAAGLTDVLAGRFDLRDVLIPTGPDGLAVLPAGHTPPNPSELLGSRQMKELVATLANHYDHVVIDAPPLLPVTDAAVLATVAEGAVLVVRHGRTRREDVQQAMETLAAVNARLLGTVLNAAPARRRKRGDGYYGYYGTERMPADRPAARSTTHGTGSLDLGTVLGSTPRSAYPVAPFPPALPGPPAGRTPTNGIPAAQPSPQVNDASSAASSAAESAPPSPVGHPAAASAPPHATAPVGPAPTPAAVAAPPSPPSIRWAATSAPSSARTPFAPDDDGTDEAPTLLTPQSASPPAVSWPVHAIPPRQPGPPAPLFTPPHPGPDFDPPTTSDVASHRSGNTGPDDPFIDLRPPADGDEEILTFRRRRFRRP